MSIAYSDTDAYRMEIAYYSKSLFILDGISKARTSIWINKQIDWSCQMMVTLLKGLIVTLLKGLTTLIKWWRGTWIASGVAVHIIVINDLGNFAV